MDQLLRSDKPNALELRCKSLTLDAPAKVDNVAQSPATGGESTVFTVNAPSGSVTLDALDYNQFSDRNFKLINQNLKADTLVFLQANDVTAGGGPGSHTNKFVASYGGFDDTTDPENPRIGISIRNIDDSNVTGKSVRVNFHIINRS